MKYLYILLLILFTAHSAFGQPDNPLSAIAGLYHGSSENRYDCSLKIDSDGTALFVYSVDHNQAYGEETGTVRKINDSVFTFALTMRFGQFIELAGGDDSLYLDTMMVIKLRWPVIEIRYSSGVKERFDTRKANTFLISRKKERKKNYTVDIGHTHPITGAPVIFQVMYGAMPDFTSGYPHKFSLIIKNGKANTIGEPFGQTGGMSLKRKN